MYRYIIREHLCPSSFCSMKSLIPYSDPTGQIQFRANAPCILLPSDWSPDNTHGVLTPSDLLSF